MAGQIGNRHFYRAAETTGDWAHTLWFAALGAAMHPHADELEVRVDGRPLTAHDWHEQAGVQFYIAGDQPDTCPHCGRRLVMVARFPAARLNVCRPCLDVTLFEDSEEEDADD